MFDAWTIVRYINKHMGKQRVEVVKMINGIHHIGVAVKDLDDAVKFYGETLNLKVEKIIQTKSVKVAIIPVGDCEIELLQSVDPEGAVANFIKERGEGIYHIAFEVDEVEKALQELKERDVQFIDEKPRMGVHKTKIVFLHPKSTMGALLELVEKRK